MAGPSIRHIEPRLPTLKHVSGSATDSLVLSDVATTHVTLGRATDSLVLSDTAKGIAHPTRATDALVLSDTAKGIGPGKSTDALVLSDSVRTHVTLGKAVDALVLADAGTTHVTLGRSTDALVLSDVATAQRTFIRNVTDALVLSDVAKGVGPGRSTDALVLSDSPRGVGPGRALDALVLADVAKGVGPGHALDSLLLSDVASALAHHVALAVDALVLTDSALARGPGHAVDVLILSDLAKGIGPAGAHDSLLLTDTARTKATLGHAFDSWLSTDAASGIVIPIPSAPLLLSALPSGANIALSWFAPGTGSLGVTYNVYRGTTSGGETLLATGVAGTTYLDTSVNPATVYYYYVKAVDVAGTSPQSNEANAIVAAVMAGLTFDLQVAFDNNPFDSSFTWTSIKQWAEALDATLSGRTDPTARWTAGQLNVTLDNRSGIIAGYPAPFTPWNTNSPFFDSDQHFGLVPGKPVRIIGYDPALNSYPVWWGYATAWEPSPLDTQNYQCKLTAMDLCDLLNRRPLANTTLLPNLVNGFSPTVYLRCGDLPSPTEIFTTRAFRDSSGTGTGTGSLVCPASTLTVPFAVAGQTGFALYDPNTCVLLGNAQAIQAAISAAQSGITSAQSASTSAATAVTTANTALSTATSQQASDLTLASNALSACGSSVGASAQATSDASNNGAAALQSSVVSAQTSTGTFMGASTWASFQADANSAIDAWVAVQIEASVVAAVDAGIPNATAQGYALATSADAGQVGALIGNALAAVGKWQNDVVATAAAQAAYNAAVAAASAASGAVTSAQATLALACSSNSAYFTMVSSATRAFAGWGWFNTANLPVSGAFSQTIAVISHPTSGSVGALQVNANGQLVFTLAGTPEITSTQLVNDGANHFVSWSLSAIGGTLTLWLDGTQIGTFASASLWPGIQPASGPGASIAVGAISTSAGALSADFIGYVGEWATMGSAITGTNVTSVYNTTLYFQQVELTGTRITKALTVALGSTALANLATSIDPGTVYCLAETSPTLQTTAFAYISNCVDTENGAVGQQPDGTFFFHQRNYPQTNATSISSQAVFGDNTGTSYHFVGPKLAIAMDDRTLYSNVQGMVTTATSSTTAGGTPTAIVPPQMQESASASSATAYGTRVLQRSGMIFYFAADALSLATLLDLRFSVPPPGRGRVKTLTVSSTSNAGVNIAQMFGRRIWDRLTTQRQYSGESQYNQDGLVEYVKHSWKANPGEWQTTWALNPYDLIVPTVTITHVQNVTSSANVTTLAISPTNVGDLLTVTVLGATGQQGILGGGVANWLEVENGGAGQTYVGIVAVVGSQPITVPSTAALIIADEFSAGTAAASWSVQAKNTTTTLAGPSLTPPNTLGELGYYVWHGSSLAAGSTAGFTYEGSGVGLVAYDTGVTGAVTPSAASGTVTGCTGLLLAASV